MSTSKTTIEINGKQYDALTGKIISEKATSMNNGTLIDGFTRNKRSNTALKATRKSKPNPAPRAIEKSQTLMRPAVKKPPQIKNDISSQRTIRRAASVNSSRLMRAETTDKSTKVSRFYKSFTADSISKKEAPLLVISPAKALPNTTSSPKVRLARSLKDIEDTIANATAHMQQLETKTISKAKFLDRILFRHRGANIASMCLAALLLIGFFGYQNAPAIEMRVASARSGVNARLPDYKPTGYGIAGAVKSESGKVTVSFKSRTDNKKFNITQSTSNWSSDSLLSNHISKKCSGCYQTYQNEGKTVYIFDNSNATWVNGGVWYQIEGNASLTSDQLLRLANSF